MGAGGGLGLAAVLTAAVLCGPGGLAGRVLSGECAGPGPGRGAGGAGPDRVRRRCGGRCGSPARTEQEPARGRTGTKPTREVTRVLEASCQKVCYGDLKRSCYKLAYFQDLSRRVGFQEARQACEIDGGALLSLESEAEQQLIENMLQNLTKSGSGISDGDFWIGLWRSGDGLATSSACPDLYQWADGSISPFRNWYTDEPSCGSEACVVMYHQPTANPGLGGPYLYQWNDDRCNMKHNFICKYGPDNVLEKELGDRAEPDYGIFPTVPAGKPYDTSKPEDQYHVIATETGIIPNLIYVVIPTIPLLLLILVAFGTCCFQMLRKSKGRTKTSPNQSTLWISKTPRKDSSMEV
ncbi:chondrolectin [Mycteria americana]|uniref:chondrolectin n=1 Tax=Mycteria americana TaxID=33587 RepID=UPI003F586C9D